MPTSQQSHFFVVLCFVFSVTRTTELLSLTFVIVVVVVELSRTDLDDDVVDVTLSSALDVEEINIKTSRCRRRCS